MSEALTLKERTDRLARALKLTPTEQTAVVRESGGLRRWWLRGCIEGDQPLPQTAGVPLLSQALANAEGWLAPELSE